MVHFVNVKRLKKWKKISRKERIRKIKDLIEIFKILGKKKVWIKRVNDLKEAADYMLNKVKDIKEENEIVIVDDNIYGKIDVNLRSDDFIPESREKFKELMIVADWIVGAYKDSVLKRLKNWKEFIVID